MRVSAICWHCGREYYPIGLYTTLCSICTPKVTTTYGGSTNLAIPKDLKYLQDENELLRMVIRNLKQENDKLKQKLEEKNK
jgi:hypothetical protein